MELSEYVIRDHGHELQLSMPEPGDACEHRGGHYSFGLPAWDLAFAEGLTGKKARVFTAQGIPVAWLEVKHVDPELFVLSGDLTADGGERRKSGPLRRWLYGFRQRWAPRRRPRRAPARN